MRPLGGKPCFALCIAVQQGCTHAARKEGAALLRTCCGAAGKCSWAAHCRGKGCAICTCACFMDVYMPHGRVHASWEDGRLLRAACTARERVSRQRVATAQLRAGVAGVGVLRGQQHVGRQVAVCCRGQSQKASPPKLGRGALGSHAAVLSAKGRCLDRGALVARALVERALAGRWDLDHVCGVERRGVHAGGAA